MGIATRIKEARLAHGWTKERLAEVLEVSPEMIWRYESGTTAVSVPLLHRLARLLHCELAYLVGAKLPDLTKDQIQLLESYARLTPEQRLLLLAVAREMGRRD